jgi:hypothetical protein
MWDMFKGAAGGFLTGKLFSNPATAYGMLLLGIAITAGLFVGGWKAGLPLPAAAGAAAFLGGGLQPRLFKNLKYR